MEAWYASETSEAPPECLKRSKTGISINIELPWESEISKIYGCTLRFTFSFGRAVMGSEPSSRITTVTYLTLRIHSEPREKATFLCMFCLFCLIYTLTILVLE
jgi:hypothetical protein